MIFAKLKPEPRKPPQHRILFLDTPENTRKFQFYLKPAIPESTKFNPEKKLNPHEWFYVELSEEQKSKLIYPYSSNQTSTADLNNAVESDYSVVDVVYRVFADGKIIFTKITNKYKIRNQMWLKFYDTEQAVLQKQENYVEFTGNRDAYFDGINKIYFRNFSTVRSMFPGIEDFYREATLEEKQRFLGNGLFKADDIDPNKIGSRDSSRIAVVLNDESIGLTTGRNNAKILSAAREFDDLGIEISADRICIKNPGELRTVLNLLTSRYYISEITGKKMESFGSTTLETAQVVSS